MSVSKSSTQSPTPSARSAPRPTSPPIRQTPPSPPSSPRPAADRTTLTREASTRPPTQPGVESLTQGLQNNFSPAEVGQPKGSSEDQKRAPNASSGTPQGVSPSDMTPTSADSPRPTGVNFRPFHLREMGDDGRIRDVPRDRFPDLPYDRAGRLELNRLTPEHLERMDPETRKQFLDHLRDQNSLGNPWVAESQLAPVQLMGLDSAVALHLHRQDPSGRSAASIFGTNPETIQVLHSGMSMGGQRPEAANDLINGVFRNLNVATAGNSSNADGRPQGGLTDAQTRALAQMTRQHIRSNGHNLDSVRDLMRSADTSLSQMQGGAQNYNTGAVLGSVLSGVKNSGANPMGSILSIMPTPNFATHALNVVAQNLLTLPGDTTGTAQQNYNQLFENMQRSLRGLGSTEAYDGFLQSIRLNERL